MVGDATMEELNEDETNPQELINEKETDTLNHFGTFLFIITGVLIWTFIGLFVGKIADDLTDHFLLKYLSYFLVYFFFLRLPFGVLNKLIIKTHEFPHFPEKNIFALTMLVFYVVGVLLADKMPHFSEWYGLLIG
ncbi:MAG: hypothetical protein AB8G86_25965 [Saprospiraceae bacterium]